jgi:ferredoxin
MHVRVDDERCKGHGVCCVSCPEVFAMTDHGYAHVLVSEVPADLQDKVQTAVEQCPEGAISIEE